MLYSTNQHRLTVEVHVFGRVVRDTESHPMLNDPLYLAVVAGAMTPTNTLNSVYGFHNSPLRVTDIAPGKSVREGAGPNVGVNDDVVTKRKVTISHSVSNENKPLTTNRTVFRIDDSFLNTDGKQVVTASAYLVTSIPVSGHYDINDALTLVQTLLASLTVNPASALTGGTGIDGAVQVPDTLMRVLDGEP